MPIKETRSPGRPAFLKDPVRKNIRFEAHHVKLLERYAKQHGLGGVTEAIRNILDTYDFA